MSYSSRYKEIKTIGQGSFGSVYLVQRLDTKELLVAKKILLAGMSEDEVQGVYQEAEVLKRLRHPNIVKYKDSFCEAGFVIIVMENCEAGDLDNHVKMKLKKREFFTEAEIMKWFVQISLALQYVHKQGILHRDIKTLNIYLTKNNTVKLGDFGISKVLQGSVAQTVVGTPLYMSPEICEGRPYSYKSDSWSLGCVLYELCTLKSAFTADNLAGLVRKIVSASVEPIPNRYSPQLRRLVSAMLEKETDRRLSIQELLEDPYVISFMQGSEGGEEAKIKQVQKKHSDRSGEIINDGQPNPKIQRFSSEEKANLEERVLELVRRRIIERGMNIRQTFLVFDENRDGSISREEFFKTFKIMDLGVDDWDITRLFSYFDTKMRGFIDYNVFCEKLLEPSTENWEEGVLEKVRTRIKEKRLSIKAAFSAFDDNRDGMISRSEFFKALKSMNLGITDSDIERLFKSFDPRGNSVIDYRSFCEKILDNKPEGASKSNSILSILRKRIQESNINLKSAFEAFDKNKDGYIIRPEFIRALNSLKLGVSESDLNQLFQEFDTDQTGSIDYREFVNKIQRIARRPTFRGENMLERIIELVRQRIKEKKLSLRQAFLAFDENKDGIISEVEFFRAFRIMDLGVTDNEVRELYRSFDRNNSGAINYSEFCNSIQEANEVRSNETVIQLIQQIMTEKRTTALQVFEAFDKNRDGRINEDEFFRALQVMELGVSDSEIRNLFRYFDRDQSGKIDFREFCVKVQESSNNSSVYSEDDVIQKIRDRIRHKKLSIRQAFQAFDENRDGSISKNEFLKAFRNIDLGVTDLEAERLFRNLDKARKGFIDYGIFCNMVQEQTPRNEDPAQERIFSLLRQRIFENQLSLRQAFLAFDKNGDGKISRQEFLKTFQMMRLGISDSEIDKLFSYFDKRKIGVIDYNNFCDIFRTSEKNQRKFE